MALDRDERPWGNYVVLDEGTDYKVKTITVFPGKRISYQRHARRQEHWLIVHGTVSSRWTATITTCSRVRPWTSRWEWRTASPTRARKSH